MFGRPKAPKPAVPGDPDRRILFEALAQRPDTVCPFLGLDGARAEYHDGATHEHRCFALGEAMELSSDQQQRVCLQRGYGNCPRYLRGVLVIPTEELEALRRPLPPPSVPTTPPSRPGGGRGGLLMAGLLVLVASGAGAGFLLLGGQQASPTPTPSTSQVASPSVAPTPTLEPSAVPTPPVTPVPDPTPRPGDQFVGYEVTVLVGDYLIYLVDEDGVVIEQRAVTFSDFSRAPVKEITAPNDRHHWRTTDGEYSGYSYIADLSGPFLIREVYQGQDGVTTYIILPDERL